MTVERLRALADNWRNNEACAANDDEYEVADAYRLCAGMIEAVADEIEAESKAGKVPDAPGVYQSNLGLLTIESGIGQSLAWVDHDGSLIGVVRFSDGALSEFGRRVKWGGRVAEPPKPE